MNWKKRLALIMVFVFMLSWINGSSNLGLSQVAACYEPTYSVTYDGNGYTGGEVPVDNNSYEEGARVTVKSPGSMVRDNYIFAGWNDKKDGSGKDYSGVFRMPDHNITLYAKWCKIPTYDVTYHGNGNTSGSAPTDPDSPYQAGVKVTVLEKEDLQKEYYTFYSWNTKADGSGKNYFPGDQFCMPPCDVDLYAVWVENNKYVLEYDGNGNTGGSAPVDPDSPYYEGENAIVLGKGDLQKEHHSFLNWNTEEDGSGTDYIPGNLLIMPGENVKLYSKWLEDPKYNVTYLGNGNDSGTVPIDVNSPYYSGEKAVVLGKNDLAKLNYSFIGWNTQSDGKGTSYSEGDIINIQVGDVLLYAQWEENPSFEVTYDGNGNESGTPPVDVNSPYYTNEHVVVLGSNGLEKDHHTFLGWNTQSDGGGQDYVEGNQFYMETSAVTLYAQWIEDPKFEIVYDGNGNDRGNAPVENDNPFYVGAEVTVLGKNTLEKDHSVFTGWNTNASGSGEPYQASDTIKMADGGIVLYAQWNASEYTVTYHQGSHGVLDGSCIFTGLHYGDLTPEAPGVTPDYGYLFDVWSPAPSATVTGDADYYATYKAVNDTIVLEKIAEFDGEEPIEVGARITYSFRTTNIGNITVENIIITDPFISLNPIDAFSLEAGQSILISDAGSHIVGEGDSLKGFFENTATATGHTEELDRPTSAADSVKVLVKSAEPGLVLDKKAVTESILPKAGEKITYEFSLTNNGTVTLYDVFVDDRDLDYTSTRVTLAPGESHTWILRHYYQVTEEDMFNGYVENEATAYGWPLNAIKPVTSTDKEKTDVELAAPGISISKRVDDSHVTAGETVQYSITVSNTGNVNLHDVDVIDEMLDIDEFKNLLSPGESFDIKVPYKTSEDDIPGVDNMATASGWTYINDKLEVTNTASIHVGVRPTDPPGPPTWSPEIKIIITATQDNAPEGTEIEYTITVSNEGNSILNNVTAICTGLQFTEILPKLYILQTMNYTVKKVMDDSGVFTYIAEAIGTSSQGKDVNDDDSVTVTITDDSEPPSETESPVEPDPTDKPDEPDAPITPPDNQQPGNPPENPETGAIPFDAYSVSGLITLGAGIFALVKRKKEAEDDEDEDLKPKL